MESERATKSPFRALALLLGLSISPPAFAANHLIAVGNNQGHKDEPLLRFAERDAQELTNVLRRLGRVSPENSLLLLGDDADALRRVILKTNVKLRSSPTQDEGDALIFYYSGHADATGLHLGESTIPYEELKALIEGSSAKVRLLIVDSCHSGGMTEIKGAVPAEPFSIRIDQRLDAEGLAIITSSSGNEDSQESVDLRASFFTHHFLTALRGAADSDRNGRITLNEAYAYAYRGTIRSSGRTTKLQHPTYLFDLKGKGDFPLSFPAEDGRGTGKLVIPDPGSYLVIEGAEDAVAAELVTEDEGTQILLAPGKYLVRQRSDTSYKEYEIQLAAGDDVDLEKVSYREITYARLLRKGGGARNSIHGLSLMVGAAGAVVDGYALTRAVAVGYSVDLAVLSLAVEGRFGLSATAEGHALTGDYRELGVRVRAEKFVDLAPFSFSLGLLVEGVRRTQVFDSRGDAPDRVGYGLGFGGLISVERELGSGFAMRLEGGPVTHVLPQGVVEGGATVRDEITTPLSWWLALGGRFSL